MDAHSDTQVNEEAAIPFQCRSRHLQLYRDVGEEAGEGDVEVVSEEGDGVVLVEGQIQHCRHWRRHRDTVTGRTHKNRSLLDENIARGLIIGLTWRWRRQGGVWR